MPRPQRSEPGASIHVVIDKRLKERMEKHWRKECGGRVPQGKWQFLVEFAIERMLGS